MVAYMCKLGSRDDIDWSVYGVFNGYKILCPRQLLPFLLFIHQLTLYSERRHQHRH